MLSTDIGRLCFMAHWFCRLLLSGSLKWLSHIKWPHRQERQERSALDFQCSIVAYHWVFMLNYCAIKPHWVRLITITRCYFAGSFIFLLSLPTLVATISKKVSRKWAVPAEFSPSSLPLWNSWQFFGLLLCPDNCLPSWSCFLFGSAQSLPCAFRYYAWLYRSSLVSATASVLWLMDKWQWSLLFSGAEAMFTTTASAAFILTSMSHGNHCLPCGSGSGSPVPASSSHIKWCHWTVRARVTWWCSAVTSVSLCLSVSVITRRTIFQFRRAVPQSMSVAVVSVTQSSHPSIFHQRLLHPADFSSTSSIPHCSFVCVCVNIRLLLACFAVR